MRFIDKKGQIYMLTDYGSGGKVWAAIRAESGEPITEVGTHVDYHIALKRFVDHAKKMGWRATG